MPVQWKLGVLTSGLSRKSLFLSTAHLTTPGAEGFPPTPEPVRHLQDLSLAISFLRNPPSRVLLGSSPLLPFLLPYQLVFLDELL